MNRYYCNDCHRYFSIDHRRKEKESLLNLHLKGTSIRTLATRIGKGLDRTYTRIIEELDTLPHNNDVTRDYCNRKRFGGEIVVDGKYISVRGYEKKIPFLYGIDYRTHDIPICLLATSESFEAWVQYFTKLRNVDYPLVTVTCDDHEAIRMAARYVFPNVLIQLCHVHFLENIRSDLRIRTYENYQSFFRDIEEHIFRVPFLGKERLEGRIRWRAPKHQNDSLKIATLQRIFEHAEELTAYVKAETWFRAKCPRTTNLIESMNKQIQGRLKTINGFKSFHSAERWLSAWILRRRMTPFTDCRGRFKKLNGTSSIENTRRGGVKLPDFFQLS